MNIYTSYNPPPDDGLDVIYQDADLLIVNKPAGLLSVPGKGVDKQDCLISRVQKHFADALIVHRLDMSTSGLILLARGAESHRKLSILFQERRVSKRYVAIVDGRIEPESGMIDLPLITDWPNRPLQKVDYDIGKPSQTHYRLTDYDAATDSSRIDITPITGRSHQLRVHTMSIGHPILGDELYASDNAFHKAERLLLHAAQLSFIHPGTDKIVDFRCEPDFDFASVSCNN